jgi:hypothetical protein
VTDRPGPLFEPEEPPPPRGDNYRRLYDFPDSVDVPPINDLWSAPSPWSDPRPQRRPGTPAAPSRRVSDRRAHPRLLGPSGVVYFRLQGRIATGELGDLSLAGALVRTRTPVAPGNVVPVAIELPALVRPIRTMARVVYVRRESGGPGHDLAGMGLAFEEMDLEDRQTLAAYLGRFGR